MMTLRPMSYFNKKKTSVHNFLNYFFLVQYRLFIVQESDCVTFDGNDNLQILRSASTIKKGNGLDLKHANLS